TPTGWVSITPALTHIRTLWLLNILPPLLQTSPGGGIGDDVISIYRQALQRGPAFQLSQDLGGFLRDALYSADAGLISPSLGPDAALCFPGEGRHPEALNEFLRMQTEVDPFIDV